MDITTTRRTFLKLAAGFTVLGGGEPGTSLPGVGSRLQSVDDPGELPRSRISGATASPRVTARRATTDRAVLDIDTGTADAKIVNRIWNTRTEETVERRVHPVEDEMELENAAGTDEDLLSMVYRETDDDLAYLFDLPAANALRSRIAGEYPDTVVDVSGGDELDRTYRPSGVDVTWFTAAADRGELTVTVPYSLYLQSRDDGWTPDSLPLSDVFPRSGDHHDRETFADLIGPLRSTIESIGRQSDTESTAYDSAEAIARFVQSVPHATDWESVGQPSYIRTPEEILVELTADCKDASLLLYNLLSAFEFDPSFVLLVEGGGTASASLSLTTGGKFDDDEDESKVEYPNHLAVAIPLSTIEPLPPTVREHVRPLEHEGTEYAYVESTAPEPIGLFPTRRESMTPVFYDSRSDLAGEVLRSVSPVS